MRVLVVIPTYNEVENIAVMVPKVRAIVPDASILVVDDNDEAREVAADRLMSLGYSVIQAANGDEALRILESSADIDLLFTDVVMPGDLDGGALASEAQLLRPALRVLFMSGYLPQALVSRNQIKAGCAILVKPYSRLQLGERLQTLLPD